LEQHVKYLRRELKVCEGCGGLWVRTGAEAGVYCRTCSALVADLPGRRRRSPGRPCTVRGTERTKLAVVHAAATTGQEEFGTNRGRCRRLAEAEVRMEETALERRLGMGLVCPVAASGALNDLAIDAGGGVEVCEVAEPVSMRKPVGRDVVLESFGVLTAVGGVR
jgi:hypothetical protein